jgi:hypothetical protein
MKKKITKFFLMCFCIQRSKRKPNKKIQR